jgi:oligosaccharyltransferase complex subunit gamma
MLQTAPVLLFFPPTVGPNAKVDAQPARFDFTNGLVYIDKDTYENAYK